MWYPYFQVFSKNRPFQVIKAKYPVRPSLQTPGTGKAKHGFQRKRGRVIPWDGDETAPLRPAGQHIGKPAQAAAEVWTSQQFRSQRFPVLPLFLKGAVLPGVMDPMGSVNRLETGGEFANSHSPVPERRCGDSCSPTAQAHHSPPGPGRRREKAVYRASGVTVTSPPSAPPENRILVHEPPPRQKNRLHQFIKVISMVQGAKRRQWRSSEPVFSSGYAGSADLAWADGESSENVRAAFNVVRKTPCWRSPAHTFPYRRWKSTFLSMNTPPVHQLMHRRI